jgi:hypothetical protein
MHVVRTTIDISMHVLKWGVWTTNHHQPLLLPATLQRRTMSLSDKSAAGDYLDSKKDEWQQEEATCLTCKQEHEHTHTASSNQARETHHHHES